MALSLSNESLILYRNEYMQNNNLRFVLHLNIVTILNALK